MRYEDVERASIENETQLVSRSVATMDTSEGSLDPVSQAYDVVQGRPYAYEYQ